MLYHFLVPLAKDYIVFNVFRYLTFRSFMALITALVIALVVGPWLIGRLRRMQHGAETLREDTPERHRGKKGTPTMGGVVILTAILGSTLLWANLTNRYVWVVMLAISGFGLIGMWDDWSKIKKRRGLSARVKFGLQLLLALALLQIVFWQPRADWQPVLAIPFFKGWLIDLGWWWFPFAMLVVVGASNAVNLTDGLDGLAAGVLIFAFVAYLFVALVDPPGRPGPLPNLAIFCALVIGALMGFLWFNVHPAQIFMGDSGALGLGATLAVVATITGQLPLLAVIGLVFFAVIMSVVLQVLSYRLRGRRIFRMAPLQHHFELLGWAEEKITLRFWIVSALAGLLGFSLFLGSANGF
ncbi:MAG: phospho-N-acetylmuramoyl-pentapeptide-transferase [Candidatus Limnocylindria bacterium]